MNAILLSVNILAITAGLVVWNSPEALYRLAWKAYARREALRVARETEARIYREAMRAE